MNTSLKLINSAGKRYYGMHFYPGVAEYREQGQEPYRVFLNEDTIRSMDASFEGKPIFVEHVDGVSRDLDQLKGEADGWVLKSFYNEADGKHWVEFLITSERGLQAIQAGKRLSNAYLPTSTKIGGLWNGVSYLKEITGGEYEHLALVGNPRYEESIVMTPEEFKQYNESKMMELKRMSNSKDKENKMGFNFFKRAKVENAVDPELCIVLPKSKVEKTITQLINEGDEAMMDAMEEKKDKDAGKMPMANAEHMVKLHDGSMCNVGELVEKHKALMDSMSGESESELKMAPEQVEVAGDKHNKDDLDEKLEESKKSNALAERKKGEDKKKADALANAKEAWLKEEQSRLMNSQPEQNILLASDKVALGQKMFGSKKYQNK